MHIFSRNISKLALVLFNVSRKACFLQDGSIKLFYLTSCSYTVFVDALSIRYEIYVLFPWYVGLWWIDAMYHPRSNHQRQCSFLLVCLGVQFGSSVSMPGKAEENHMKWLWVLSESHSGDPEWQWALTSRVPIMSFVGKSSAEYSVPRRMEWSIVSLRPKIVRWWLNLNFSSASLGMTCHSDNCSFIVVVVTQSSLTWVQGRIEGGEVKVEVYM